MPEVIVLLLGLFLGCTGDADKDDGDDDGGTTTTPLTDEEVCHTAAVETIGCHASGDLDTMVSDCLAADASYRDCLRASLGDCNAEAICGFEAVCGGAGPGGTQDCGATTDCQLGCSTAADPAACWCGCVVAMDPAVARYVSANDSCSHYNCYAQCEGSGANPADCAACNDSLCATVDDECLAH